MNEDTKTILWIIGIGLFIVIGYIVSFNHARPSYSDDEQLRFNQEFCQETPDEFC